MEQNFLRQDSPRPISEPDAWEKQKESSVKEQAEMAKRSVEADMGQNASWVGKKGSLEWDEEVERRLKSSLSPAAYEAFKDDRAKRLTRFFQ